MDLKELSKLPSPFYRVSVKAIILNDQGQLLLGEGEDEASGWELPGGGFEYDESIEDCVKRELKEELGVEVTEVGGPLFIYRGQSRHKWMIVRIAVPVKLNNFNFKFGDMKRAKFVSKDELETVNFNADEGTFVEYIDKIWPNM